MTAIKDRLQEIKAEDRQENDDTRKGLSETPREDSMSTAKDPASTGVKAPGVKTKAGRKTRAKTEKPVKIDPLFAIFEQHLLNFQDPEINRKTFIAKVVADYLSYLRKMNVTVPKSLEQPIVEELAEQVNTILVKRIYGCFSIEEYRKSITPTIRRRARTRYSRLGFR